MQTAEASVRSRVRSAVWGVALAGALVASTALPWERGYLTVTSHGVLLDYFTLWQLRAGAAAPVQKLSGLAGATLVLLGIVVVLLLAAAAEATGGTALAAGIAALASAGAEIGWWLYLGAANPSLKNFGPVQVDSGLQVAFALSALIAVTYVPLGIVRNRRAGRRRPVDNSDLGLSPSLRRDVGLE